MPNSGQLRRATITDDYGKLISSKYMLWFSASVLLAPSSAFAILPSYLNLSSSFGAFAFSNLGLGGGLF